MLIHLFFFHVILSQAEFQVFLATILQVIQEQHAKLFLMLGWILNYLWPDISSILSLLSLIETSE